MRKQVNKLNVNNKEKSKTNQKKFQLRNMKRFCVHMCVKFNTIPTLGLFDHTCLCLSDLSFRSLLFFSCMVSEGLLSLNGEVLPSNSHNIFPLIPTSLRLTTNTMENLR